MKKESTQLEHETLEGMLITANEYVAKGLGTVSELSQIVDAFPDTFVVDTENGTLGLTVTPEQQTLTSPTDPTENALALNESTSILPDSNNRIIPSNMSLDGRPLNITFREQKLLHLIRTRRTTAEIRSIYSQYLPNKATGQMERDILHLTEVLNIYGSTIARIEGDDGLRFVEKKRELKPHPQPSTFKAAPQSDLSKRQQQPGQKYAPPAKKVSLTNTERPVFNSDNLTPTERIAHEILIEHPDKSPLTEAELLTQINRKRNEIGASPLRHFELENLTQTLTNAGFPVICEVRFGKRVYFKL